MKSLVFNECDHCKLTRWEFIKSTCFHLKRAAQRFIGIPYRDWGMAACFLDNARLSFMAIFRVK